MSRYRDDPRRITAKYAGTDANGRPFAKGEQVTSYPKSRRIVSGEAGEQALRDIEADDFDMMGGR